MKIHAIVVAAMFVAAAPFVQPLQQRRGTHAPVTLDPGAVHVLEQMGHAYTALHSFSVGISADYGGASVPPIYKWHNLVVQ